MIIKKIEERMNLSLGAYSKELSTIRTGRANPKMLDGVRVEVYGQKMPISQLATVSIPEPQMINVQVWDKANVSAVDQAIRTSDLNLNPQRLTHQLNVYSLIQPTIWHLPFQKEP